MVKFKRLIQACKGVLEAPKLIQAQALVGQYGGPLERETKQQTSEGPKHTAKDTRWSAKQACKLDSERTACYDAFIPGRRMRLD